MESDKIEIGMYLNLMQEVKNRIHSILDICIYHKRTTSFNQTNTEFCYLQLRKVLELIAFGSIVMNKDEVAKQDAKFRQRYNAKYILNDIKQIHPNFFPVPLPSWREKLDFMQGLTEDSLTEDEFVELYEHCGGILHARNPYRAEIDYNKEYQNVITYVAKIVNLLNVHLINLYECPDVYMITMVTPGTEAVRAGLWKRV